MCTYIHVLNTEQQFWCTTIICWKVTPPLSCARAHVRTRSLSSSLSHSLSLSRFVYMIYTIYVYNIHIYIQNKYIHISTTERQFLWITVICWKVPSSKNITLRGPICVYVCMCLCVFVYVCVRARACAYNVRFWVYVRGECNACFVCGCGWVGRVSTQICTHPARVRVRTVSDSEFL